MHERLDAAIDLLRASGFRVREGASLRCQRKGTSADAMERASELMGALLDDEVAAIIPPWGGERAIELLRLMDFDRLATAPPKWFSGFSDLSTIQIPLLLRSSWASIHGPNLMQLPEFELDATTARVFDAWRCGPGGTLVQSAAATTTAVRLDRATEPVCFSGRMLGGCLDSISRLAGSPYGAVPAFGQAHRQDGLIVFLENAEMKPFELARALSGLRFAGWFDAVTGILIGRNALDDGEQVDDFSARDAIEAALGDLDCPVILDVDIGHVSPQWSIVQGAKGTVEWSDGTATLHQVLE
jgi:muramoyltetrapeptide carboxypeptidase LdcA involved in peptidoglycan recycling